MQGRPLSEMENGGESVSAGSAPRLYQRVIAILAGQIRRGTLAADAALTETAVAALFGISRAPARRALLELEQEGLIARSGARGFVVVARRRNRGARRESHDGAEAGDLKLVPQPSWERIYGAVEGEIIARTSFASWRVNEAEFARHYGVSRTVARDVIGRLQQRGVVQKDDRSRWYAPALSAEHVGELYELRWILEPLALTKAAPNLPDGLLPRVHRNVAEALSHAYEIGGETLDQLERDLHVTLLGYCRNRALVQAITAPQSLIIAHRFLYRWTSRLFATEPFLPEHLEVIERLQAGRIADAAKSLETHLRVSRDRAMARVNLIAGGAQPDPLPYLERLPAPHA
ncbi:MAG TPA: GntR family transcriptional regulator [Hyphomicrobiaceae bacterium]|nr:GntR family transcriptional regulator [Hyphomicrobiaceae bacterium]